MRAPGLRSSPKSFPADGQMLRARLESWRFALALGPFLAGERFFFAKLLAFQYTAHHVHRLLGIVATHTEKIRQRNIETLIGHRLIVNDLCTAHIALNSGGTTVVHHGL